MSFCKAIFHMWFFVVQRVFLKPGPGSVQTRCCLPRCSDFVGSTAPMHWMRRPWREPFMLLCRWMMEMMTYGCQLMLMVLQGPFQVLHRQRVAAVTMQWPLRMVRCWMQCLPQVIPLVEIMWLRLRLGDARRGTHQRDHRLASPSARPSSKWISCHIPAKFGGPTIHVLMPEALALTEWFNEDLKSCIFEYADAKSAGPPFQFVKAKMKLAGWQIAKRKPRDVNKVKKHMYGFDSTVKRVPRT